MYPSDRKWWVVSWTVGALSTPNFRKEKNQRMRVEKWKRVIRASEEQDRKQEALEPLGAPLKGELRANKTRLIMQSHNAENASNMHTVPSFR